MTIEQVAEHSGGDWTAAAISRWETGDRRIRPIDLRGLLDIYDVRGEKRDVLLTLAREARQRGWWQSYSDAVPEWFQVYGGNCVEVASNLPGVVAVRDSKNPDGPALAFSPDEWRAFLAAIQAEELSL